MFLLLPSPLLGPATWRPVEQWLQTRGHEARSVDFGTDARTPDQVVDAVVREASGAHGPVVLVPHSNAGLYAPHLADLLDVESTVYVDAALPDPDHARPTGLAPPAFLDFLRELVQPDGLLPPWTGWWPDVSDLFPDEPSRRAVEAEQQRLPLAYFTSTVPVPHRWQDRPAAYLAFADTYAAEHRFAQASGWPTVRMEGGHLHQLWEPAAVGAALLDLSR